MYLARMKSASLKVFGISTFLGGANNGKQLHAIVATTSQREAAACLDMSLHEFRIYSAVTGNAVEIETATARPNVVFWQDLNAHGDDRNWWFEWEDQRRYADLREVRA
jgi:hypothetical protein